MYVHGIEVAPLSPDDLPGAPALQRATHHLESQQDLFGTVTVYCKIWGTSIITAAYVDRDDQIVMVSLFRTTPLPYGQHLEFNCAFERKREDSQTDRDRAERAFDDLVADT